MREQQQVRVLVIAAPNRDSLALWRACRITSPAAAGAVIWTAHTQMLPALPTRALAHCQPLLPTAMHPPAVRRSPARLVLHGSSAQLTVTARTTGVTALLQKIAHLPKRHVLGPVPTAVHQHVTVTVGHVGVAWGLA